MVPLLIRARVKGVVVFKLGLSTGPQGGLCTRPMICIMEVWAKVFHKHIIAMII